MGKEVLVSNQERQRGKFEKRVSKVLGLWTLNVNTMSLQRDDDREESSGDAWKRVEFQCAVVKSHCFQKLQWFYIQ
jgi:hypothetical protein